MTIPSDSMEQKAREKSLELWQATTNTPDPYSDSDWLIIDEMEKALISFAAAQVAEERARCADIASRWRAFYSLMQEKSKHGEKDGLYRAMAADDIHRDILNPASPATGGGGK